MAGGARPSRLEVLLADRPAGRSGWDLERIRHMLDRLGHPERSYAALHVAGTNGKGSTAAGAAAVLSADGIRTGLYTSPHILSFDERIQIDGRPVTADLLERSARRLQPLAEACDPSYFETATALAFRCFADAEIEVAVIETGLGGRLDATNTLEPQACAITSIARDHTELLGESISEIALEKAGILKPGVPVAVGRLRGAAAAAVEARALELAAPLLRIGVEATVAEVRVEPTGTAFSYRSPGFPAAVELATSLVGAHQAENAALACLMLEARGVVPSRTALRCGLKGVRLPGRFQRLRTEAGSWILDIAHNPAGIRALGEALGRVRPEAPLVALVGILRDKAWPAMLGSIAEWASQTVATVPPTAPLDRRWRLDAMGESVAGQRSAVIEANFDEALRRARELAGAGTVVVTGSTYTVGDALRRLRDRART